MESQCPSNSMQDSSSTIPNLPSELITEIFLRLSVKSLVRYRLISKYLLDLISRHFSSMRLEVKIYSLMSNSWKSVDHSYRLKEIFRNISGKFVNGKLHWSTSYNIFSIDMSDEKWENVDKPSNGKGDFMSELEVLGSNLSVLCYKIEEYYVSIWVMKEYGVKESWTMMYNINDIHNLYLSYFMLKKGEILAGLARYFKIYYPKDDWFSPNIINFDCDQEAGEIYVESLVSPFPSEGRTSNATKIMGLFTQE